MDAILRASLVAGLLIGSFAPPATATLIDVTVIGTVESGTDIGGFFGAPGANLANQSFTVLYRFDTSLGTTTTTSEWTDNFGFGLNSPSLGATMTIGGRHVFTPGNDLGEAYLESNSRDNFTFYIADGLTPEFKFRLFTYLETAKPLGDTVPLSFVPFFLDNPTVADGFFTIRSEVTREQLLNLSLLPRSVELSYPAPAAVPVPAVGAVPGLILAVGALLSWRRRRRKIAGELSA